MVAWGQNWRSPKFSKRFNKSSVATSTVFGPMHGRTITKARRRAIAADKRQPFSVCIPVNGSKLALRRCPSGVWLGVGIFFRSAVTALDRFSEFSFTCLVISKLTSRLEATTREGHASRIAFARIPTLAPNASGPNGLRCLNRLRPRALRSVQERNAHAKI
jgi:hypothetical protein